MNRRSQALAAALFLSLTPAALVWAQPILPSVVERFLADKVKVGGFAENANGVSISHGSRFFDTSNRFVMNRLTIQPEISAALTDDVDFFVSWRFVKEPRYSMEDKSRRKAVQPTGRGKPLGNTYYDEYSPVPWETVLDYKPNDRLTLRWGRQFISWGETDGFRLIDLINPQDSTFAPPAAPNLFSLDETRIPSWGLRALYTVKPETNTIIEYFALPGALDRAEHRIDEFLGSNDTADGAVRYGRWSAHPETRLPFGRLFANPIGTAPVVVPLATRELPDSTDSWKVGTRVTRTLGKLTASVGYIWGYNPQASDMVFRIKGAPSLCGPPACSPSATRIRLQLINDRTSIFAGQFSYPIAEMLAVPINTTMRGEVALLPRKTYNISEFPGRHCGTGTLTGFIAGPSCKYRSGIVKKNTLRYTLGFDRATLIPFLHPDDPWRTFNLSFQALQTIIFDHEPGIRAFSSAEKIKRASTILTFRAATGYLGDTILPDIFLAYDPEGYYALNPAITYAVPWDEKIRLTLTAALYGGRNKFKSFGLFSEKDSVFLKMRYQF